MDADETLRHLRKAMTDFDAAIPNSPEEFVAAAMLVDDFRALDNHLSKGGLIPSAWTGGE